MRPLLLGLLLVGVVTQIVALMPRLTEKGDPGQELQPEALIQDLHPKNEKMLATGIPQDKVPDYAIEDFQYVSTVQGQRQWLINAKRAFLFNLEKVVVTRVVHGNLYDPEGKIIVVTSKEAKYYMNGRDLELFGDVVATFPDGFVLESDYLRYKPQPGEFDVPVEFPVRGHGREKDGTDYVFTSEGMHYLTETGELKLPRHVQLDFTRHSAREVEQTRVFADECDMHRKVQSGDCRPSSARPTSTRFVQIAQNGRNGVQAKSRHAHLDYAGTMRLVHYVTLTGDVTIIENENVRSAQGAKGAKSAELATSFAPELITIAARNPKSRYSTSGKAEFDATRDLIVLTDYPQVYQEADTVTGERILLHRDSDLVEIEHSNAYSDGTSSPQK